jgi:hypothetical protein
MTTYNNFAAPSAAGLGLPGAGFASRGKGNGIKRLNLASPPKIGSISEDPSAEPVPTPRTSRSHLLAGLRTAPRTPGAVPASAPYNKTHHNVGYGAPQYAQQQSMSSLGNVPHTATGANFPMANNHQQHHQHHQHHHHQQHQHQHQGYGIQPGQQYYVLPEQVLAPPSLELDEVEEPLDPQTIAALYATELHLANQQRRLQQQIASLAANQFSGLSINSAKPTQTSFPQTPITPQVNMFNNQLLQNAIFTQEVPGQPGVYLVTNTMTGQSTLAYDPNYHAQLELANSPPPPTPSQINTNFPVVDRRRDAGSPFDIASPYGSRSVSPPKKAASPPQDVVPLPPPSANAFRRGQHNRNKSSLVINNTNGVSVSDGPKSAFIRPVGMPATPMTGTFGPGQNRAGEHPIRQPTGPPSIDELKLKPTTKHEGSKNFATRQRRRALNKLVRAGFERRNVRPGSASGGSVTPVSDNDQTYSIPSDNDSESGKASMRSLSSKPSLASLRATRPIGSERKASRESIKET